MFVATGPLSVLVRIGLSKTINCGEIKSELRPWALNFEEEKARPCHRLLYASTGFRVRRVALRCGFLFFEHPLMVDSSPHIQKMLLITTFRCASVDPFQI